LLVLIGKKVKKIIELIQCIRSGVQIGVVIIGAFDLAIDLLCNCPCQRRGPYLDMHRVLVPVVSLAETVM